MSSPEKVYKTGKEIAAIHRDSGKGELGDWVKRSISYPAKDLRIEVEDRVIYGLNPRVRQKTFVKRVHFNDLISETYTALGSDRSFVNSKPGCFFREATFDGRSSNEVRFYLDDTKGFFKITKGKNNARLNKTTGEIENIEGTWSKEEINKYIGEIEWD